MAVREGGREEGEGKCVVLSWLVEIEGGRGGRGGREGGRTYDYRAKRGRRR